MSQTAFKGPIDTLRSVPYDLICFGLVMIVSGIADIYIIMANPEYQLPVMGMKFGGKTGRFILYLFPLLHFISGYGVIFCRKWAYKLFICFAAYGIVSPLINYFRVPPPHRIRTMLLIGSFIVLVYLYWRRAHFKN